MKIRLCFRFEGCDSSWNGDGSCSLTCSSLVPMVCRNGMGWKGSPYFPAQYLKYGLSLTAASSLVHCHSYFLSNLIDSSSKSIERKPW
jgi:hypothetical protein